MEGNGDPFCIDQIRYREMNPVRSVGVSALRVAGTGAEVPQISPRKVLAAASPGTPEIPLARPLQWGFT